MLCCCNWTYCELQRLSTDRGQIGQELFEMFKIDNVSTWGSDMDMVMGAVELEFDFWAQLNRWAEPELSDATQLCLKLNCMLHCIAIIHGGIVAVTDAWIINILEGKIEYIFKQWYLLFLWLLIYKILNLEPILSKRKPTIRAASYPCRLQALSLPVFPGSQAARSRWGRRQQPAVTGVAWGSYCVLIVCR